MSFPPSSQSGPPRCGSLISYGASIRDACHSTREKSFAARSRLTCRFKSRLLFGQSGPLAGRHHPRVADMVDAPCRNLYAMSNVTPRATGSALDPPMSSKSRSAVLDIISYCIIVRAIQSDYSKNLTGVKAAMQLAHQPNRLWP
jgi:hypothetical protein